ncbi:hypothetical protein QAD02_000293 [Eretmocerus hayati]|uniref:Uncharacterized protein n=1 Tax=Eretmocerus hayati TaxID=131215 RepID=A0ACC2NFC3_9HYME|nr:hypothetical protein QAD02_000293 [Eretmocerus hayati]
MMEPKSRSLRVVRGYQTTIESYPYMVSLKKDNNEHICGDTIIDEYTILTSILTAAHCLDTGEVKIVRVGCTYVDSKDGVLHKILDHALHENYESEDYPINDISFIRFESPIVVNNITSRIVKSANRNTMCPDSSFAIVVGWGFVTDKTNAEPSEIVLIEDEKGGRISY